MKGKTLWIVAVVVGLLALVLLSSPVGVDTRIRLEREGTAPFDAEVFYELLPGWIGAPVSTVGEPPFVHLADTTLTGTTYLFLTRSFEPGEAEAERLLAYVERGNTLFVAAHAIGGPFARAIGSPDSTVGPLGTPWGMDALMNGYLGMADSLRLEAPGVQGTYRFPVGVQSSELFGMDPARTEVLGTSGDGDGATLLRVRVGAGMVVVSSTPLAFSNAALVGEGDGAAYASAVLASLPRQPVLWDDYKKPYRSQAQTPLRYVVNSPGLAGAYWLLLALGVLFLLFRGRRWQRAIPVVTPPPNAQREFAQTVGRLHFTHGDTARLAERAERVLLDKLRTRLRMVDPDFSEETARRAARRAGIGETEAVALFARIRRLQKTSNPSGADLVDLDARVDRFFRHLDAPARSEASDADPPREEAEAVL